MAANIAADPGANQRFEREAKAISRLLTHTFVCSTISGIKAGWTIIQLAGWLFLCAATVCRTDHGDGTLRPHCRRHRATTFSPALLGDALSDREGTSNKDGVIVFTPSGQLADGLYRVSVSGGTSIRIKRPDAGRSEDSHRGPMFLPDQKHFLYPCGERCRESGPGCDLRWHAELKREEVHNQGNGKRRLRCPGYLLYYRDKTLFAQRFDAAKLELIGEAVPTVTDIAYLPRIVHAAYAVSDTGLLVAQSGSGVSLSRLVWYDYKGNETGTASKPDVYSNIELAPDGKTVALDKTDEESTNGDIWTYDFQRDAMEGRAGGEVVVL